MRSIFILLGVAYFVCVQPSLAEAPQSAHRLEYRVSPELPECPPEEQLHQEVALRMGYDPFRADAAASVSVSIVPRGDRIVAHIRYRDAAGDLIDDREMTVSSNTSCACWSLITSTAVLISFSLSPFHVPEPPPPLALPPTSPAFQLSAGALAFSTFMPQTTFGTFASVALRWPSFSIALEHRLYLPPPPVSAPGGLLDLDMDMDMTAAVFCLHRDPLFGCVVGEIGPLRLSSTDAVPDSDLFTAMGGRVGVELPLLPQFAFDAYAEVSKTINPLDTRINHSDVWKTPLWSGLLGAGFVLTL